LLLCYGLLCGVGIFKQLKSKKMKKIRLFLVIISLSVTFFGCDPPRYYSYFINNNCDELIDVKIEVNHRYNSAMSGDKIEKLNFSIMPDSTKLFISSEYWKPLDDIMIEFFFEKIIITKGSDTSKVNYVDKDLWEFKKTSKNHANSYLTVYPEDFE